MNPFEYTRANDVADAVRQIAADPAAKFIAGGTNLIDLMKENVARPSRLIDIKRRPLNKVEETEDRGLRIGALIPNSDLAYHRRSRHVIRCSAVPSSPVPHNNCATWPRRAATCCNERAACISTISPRPAISASRGAAAQRLPASTACTRSWERASTVSRPILRTCAWDLLLLMRAC